MSTIEKMQEWSKYLSEEDFSFLVNFVDNAKNGLKQEEPVLILRGLPRTGKSTLMKAIAEIIGKDNCVYTSLYFGSHIYNPRNFEFGNIAKDKYPHLYYAMDCTRKDLDASVKIYTQIPITGFTSVSNIISKLVRDVTRGYDINVWPQYHSPHRLKSDGDHACSCIFVLDAYSSDNNFVLKTSYGDILHTKTIELTHVFAKIPK